MVGRHADGTRPEAMLDPWCDWTIGGEGGGVGGGDEEKEGNQHKEAEPRENGAAAGINDALVDG